MTLPGVVRWYDSNYDCRKVGLWSVQTARYADDWDNDMQWNI